MSAGPGESLRSLAELLQACAGRVAVLTGAGISVESGIPDFRTPGEGLWTRIDPMELSVESLRSRPETFFRRCLEVFRPALDARPNPGHRALAKLESMAYIGGIVTQNIDGLHQQAGSREVIEVHGNLRTGTCMGCGKRVALEQLLRQLEENNASVPRCWRCEGVLRPDVVIFGDPMPDDFRRAQEFVSSCALLLVVGSSLEVYPVNSLPALAPEVAILNLDTTPWDAEARVCINGKAGDLLPALAELLRSNGAPD